MIKLVKRRWFKASISTIIITVLAVVLFSIFNNGKNIKNTQDFINELKSKGYKVETVEVPKQSKEWFAQYNGKNMVIKVNDTYINYYEFQTEELAKNASETISKDGCTISPKGKSNLRRININWGTAVKFYRKGNIIVQYEGTNFKLLWHLRTIMGKSIASSPLEYLLFKKFIRKN